MMFTRDEMLIHGNDWISAWNRKDIEKVLAGFSEDAIFCSPMAARLASAGVLNGKNAIRSYWRAAVAELSHIHFRPLAMICDETAQAMVIHYEAELDEVTLRACEIFDFADGCKIAAEALYGEARTRSKSV